MKLQRIRKPKYLLVIFLPIQILIIQILKRFPEVVERYYSLGMYPLISKISRFLLGWMPFSVGDIFYLGVGIFAIRWMVVNFKNWRKKPLSLVVDIVASFSIVYFVFHLLWGLNYYRLPLHRVLKIQNEYAYDELLSTTKMFITKSNELHSQLTSNDSAIVPVPYSQKEFYAHTSNGYQTLQKEFPNLNYHPRSIKNSLWSTLLSYMGYSGYINPFSGEAQVNGLIHFYKFPVIACHEEAHQIGFAAENEANFIATLATLRNDDLYIQYAGSIFALRYLLGDVARQNREDFEQLRNEVHPGIIATYREANAFWEKYDNPFDKIFLAFFDNFLKASNQSGGIRSYNYVVALLVNYDLEGIEK